MKKALLLTTIGTLLCIAFSQAQDVFDPTDPTDRWRSGDPLGTRYNPNTGIEGLQKWVSVASAGVSTGSGSYDATSYKAYFINVGGPSGAKMPFRLKFPKSYNNPDSNGKKYPIMVFYHGAGEPGCPSNGGFYNNERQLVHGGRSFRDRVDNNQFDGFLLYPQAVVASGCWSDWGLAPFSPYYDLVIRVIDSLSKYERTDVDKVFVDGLSNGGSTAWSMASVYPQRVTKVAPSAAGFGGSNYLDFVHIPIWFATGGRDTNPSPAYAAATYNNIKAVGADIKYTLYPDLGHGVWNNHWADPGFIPFMNDMHKANPLVYFQRYDFCPDSPISTKIGITAGFYAYEWQKDGVLIASRTNGVNTVVDPTPIISYVGNDITVKAFGTYRVRFKRTASGPWSLWSPKPAVIAPKPVTQTPDIQVIGLRSKVVPAPDGSTTVPLQLPEGFTGYNWFRNDTTLVGTQRTFDAPAGNYKAKVIEQFGCGSLASPVFKVVSADAVPKPDPAKNLTAVAASLTSIQLDWSENPNSGQNETGFEIYRSKTAGGPYALLTITAPNVVSYLDNGLQSNTEYFYIVRAVGNFGAAENSNEAVAETAIDNAPPAPPANFTVLATATNYAFVKWNAATDNVGVDKYDIYVNGSKKFSTTQTSFTIANLDSNQVYTFYVRARDAAGNISSPSNQVTASTAFTQNGLNYKYYENTYTSLPNFNFETIVKTGVSNTPDISVRTVGRNDNFAFLWEGYIKVPTSATYTFELCSDAGSNLYIGTPYGMPELLNNDGNHGNVCKSKPIYLAAGVHPIAIAYFESTGSSQSITLSWQNNAGLSKVAVPSTAYFRRYEITTGSAPEAPGNLVATGVAYNKIDLTWDDNSSNETGFEIVRATSFAGTYIPIATVPGTSYTDSGLTANTKYYYKVRAVSATGESAFSSNFTEVNWQLNNDGNDANGSATRTLGFTNTTFNAADKKDGSHALSFNGTNAYATVNSSSSGAFPSDGGYTQRTVAVWIKPTAATLNNKRTIFDFGSNANGLGLRFNGTNILQAGVASGSTRTSISLSNLTTNANWVSGDWNHVAVVYNQNSLKLFLNTVEVASNNALTHTNIAAASSNNARLGYSGTSNSDNVFNEASTNSDFYNGLMDAVYVINGAMNDDELNTLRNFNYAPSWDTTKLSPVAPVAPSGLVVTLQPGNNINLQWNDNSDDETGFEIWRSLGNNTNYRLTATVPGGAGAQKTYSDTSLFANVTYYYKVRAKGVGGNSAYTTEGSATTLNKKPVLEHVMDFTMRYNTSYALSVNASDVDGDALTFTADDLPYFATIEGVSNGNANIVFTPSIADQGAYTIILYVSDEFGGRDTTHFTMVVNNNSVPVMNPIGEVTLNEGANPYTIPIVANDLQGNNFMVWSTTDMPSFATFVDSGNGRASVTLAPGYNTSGTYTMTVTVDDGYGAWTNREFSVIVNELDPNEKIQVSMMYYTGFVPLWNDIDCKVPNFNVGNLRNTKNAVTPVGINVVSGTYSAFGDGQQTGNNSGVYPDAIISDYLKWGGASADDTLKLRVRGLDVNKRYNFVFFGSNNCPWCGFNTSMVTTYKIGNAEAQVHFLFNSNETDTIYQVQPNASGEVFITMIGDAHPGVGGYLNALVIDAQFDDGTTPVKPLNLTAQPVPNEGVRLTWVDKAYNENTFKIYRATTRTGPYTLLNPNAQNADTQTYLDANVSPFTTYFYYVVGANRWGNGGISDTAEVITANNKPAINGLNNLFVKTDATLQEDFSVSDDAGDVLTVTIPDLPPFVTLQSLGSNNYRITAAPTADNIGWTGLTVNVADNKGGVTTQSINVGVADKNTRSVFLNLGLTPAPLPWNNMLGWGNPGTNRTNLPDENNVPTTFDITLIDNWADVNRIGHRTGNNSGVFPDSVLQSGIIDMGTGALRIRFNGLDDTKRYNLVFVGSLNEGTDASAKYVAGAISDTLNARYNTNQTANLNGLQSVGGEILVSITKLPSSSYVVLNGLQIEEYAPALPPLSPLNLYVEPKDRNRVSLSWSDRTNNEDASGGFQVQRATDSLFTQNLQSFNLASNTTAYTDTVLAPNTKYWFRVRAKVGGNFTDFSNRVRTITPQAIVYFNLNFSTSEAAFPWNNASAPPDAGMTFTDLKNQSGQPSGLTLSIERGFNGENVAGVNTGNNSGIVPDRVLESCFWLDNTQVSTIKVSGLNQGKRYRFGFIGSMGNVGWFFGDYSATYTINGRTVYLNSWLNSTKIVYIGDVVPDANGEVLVDFSTTDLGDWGFNSGMIIQTYDDANGGTVENIITPGTGNNPVVETVVLNPLDQQAAATERKGLVATRTYPNPFNDYVNLDFNNAAASNEVGVDIYDLSGKLIYRRTFGKLPAGFNTLRLNTAESNLGIGVYMITLHVNGKAVHTAKMIRAAQ